MNLGLHFHQRRGHHVLHLPWGHHAAAGAYVGRLGILAIAFGIGTAAATGFCEACAGRAYGDTGDSTADAGVSTSQTVTSSTRSSAGSVRAAQSHAGPRASRQHASSHAAPASTANRPDVRFTLPDASPSSPAPAVHLPVTGPSAHAQTADPGPTRADAPAAAPSVTSTPVTPQPTSGGTPAAADAPLVATITNVSAALADSLTGSAPVIPADTAVAALLAAGRRERNVPSLAARTATSRNAASATATAPVNSVEAEAFVIAPSGGGRVQTDRSASAGSALVLTSGSSSASATVNLPASTALVIRAKSTLNSGAPNMTVAIDGVPVTTIVVNGTYWSNYTMTGVIPAGSHVLTVSTSNATSKRSLYIDTMSVTSGPFIEDFTGSSGSSPSAANWSIKTGSGWDPGVENYQTGNATLDGQGNLVLKAMKSKSGYTSGWVESKNKVSFGYGTITARIKVPKGQGLWPAFWLKGANEDTVAWPQSGEIDVLELPSTTTTIYATLHGPIAGSTDTQQAQVIGNVPDLSTGYHNYWVNHLPDSITFGVDNLTLGTLTPDSLSPGSQWVYNQPMFAIMNLAVGGSWAGPPNSSTPFPSSVVVDWIRWDPPA